MKPWSMGPDDQTDNRTEAEKTRAFKRKFRKGQKILYRIKHRLTSYVAPEPPLTKLAASYFKKRLWQMYVSDSDNTANKLNPTIVVQMQECLAVEAEKRRLQQLAKYKGNVCLDTIPEL